MDPTGPKSNLSTLGWEEAGRSSPIKVVGLGIASEAEGWRQQMVWKRQIKAGTKNLMIELLIIELLVLLSRAEEAGEIYAEENIDVWWFDCICLCFFLVSGWRDWWTKDNWGQKILMYDDFRAACFCVDTHECMIDKEDQLLHAINVTQSWWSANQGKKKKRMLAGEQRIIDLARHSRVWQIF